MASFLEYRGKLFKFEKNHAPGEMWFIVKNKSKHPNISINTLEAYAMIWAAHKKCGCTYEETIMETIKLMEKQLS